MNLNSETKKELFTKLDKLKNEINSINKDLNRKNSEKETWLSKKEDSAKNIREKIASIKENKKKRDSLTKKVKELKEKRRDLNQPIRKKISELIKLKNETKVLTKQSKIKDPQRIKGGIDSIEVKLETEAMPFEKEKVLSKKLKQLKKLMGEASIISNNIGRIKKFNSEIDASKKNSNETHNEIQKLAAQSQDLHEGIIKTSKEIDKLKLNEDEAFKNFVNSKKFFNDLNNKLKEKLSLMNGIRSRINKFKLEEEEKRKLEESTLVKSKEQEIEEKIKTGKKLTTDDFLAFQESIKNKKKI
ncbi:hypothetical protein CMO94_00250 [Candidatus Woesearchaeota archaeon]|jgi:uncharacterized coiled-coil DUF342 family protein|nr:hypothetical protein [Candidatus Woesearchaeota archaeon]